MPLDPRLKADYHKFGMFLVLALTLAVHLIGSTALAVITGGPAMVLAGPVLALFGWFFLPVEFVAVAAQWLLYSAFSFSRRAYWVLLGVSVILVPGLVALNPIKEQGSEVRWTIAYLTGAALAGGFSMLALRMFVAYLQRKRNEQCA